MWVLKGNEGPWKWLGGLKALVISSDDLRSIPESYPVEGGN